MNSDGMSNNQNKLGVTAFPWLRASFFVMVVFVAVLPFTSVPARLKGYAKEIIVAKGEAKRTSQLEIKAQHEGPETVPKSFEKSKSSELAKTIKEPEITEIVVQAISPHSTTEGAGSVKTTKIKPVGNEEGTESGFEAKVFTRQPVVEETRGDMIRLSKGFHFKYELETVQAGLASEIRNNNDSYVAEYKLKLQVPKASTQLEELESVNPMIGEVLPGLASSLEGAQVSKFFDQLYQKKLTRVESDVLKLNVLITKHNYFDCETILNLKHPETGRKFLLVQADMDVVSDGSDGDRLAKMPSKIVDSTNYQPFTSYGWKKTTGTPNPMVKGWVKRIANAKREIADKNITDYRKQWLRNRIKMLQRGIDDMKARSFLIAEYDPFIVMPVNVITDRSDPYAARVGDYAVVVVGDNVYPAIVGDGGPTYKVGEASLRMAREINQKASPYSRPVSDLSVTYIVFCNSREKYTRQPNYNVWREKCASLIDEIGGLGEAYELYQWTDLLKKEVQQAKTTSVKTSEATTPAQ